MIALLAAACGGDDDASDSTPAEPVEIGAATNAIEVRVPAPPRYTRGADGNVHLEYDLITTDVMTAPVTLDSLVVTSGETELARLDADALEAVTFQFLSADATLDVAPSAAVVSIVDIILPTEDFGDVPNEVTNELSYRIGDDAPFRTLIATLTAISSPIEVAREDPIVVQPPLRGDGWWSFNGCCVPNAHRSGLFASQGTLHSVETFAIDWVRLVDGSPAQGDGSEVSDYYGYGETVYSATDGEVVGVRNDLEDAPVNDSGSGNETVKGPSDYGGNGLTVKIRDGQYAFYAHMITGSVIPEVGDQIKAGDEIGKLGNTGNSSVPHLHFGIQASPDVFGSDSLPFVISSYTLAGTADTNATGDGVEVSPANAPQENTTPLVHDLADFGNEATG